MAKRKTTAVLAVKTDLKGLTALRKSTEKTTRSFQELGAKSQFAGRQSARAARGFDRTGRSAMAANKGVARLANSMNLVRAAMVAIPVVVTARAFFELGRTALEMDRAMTNVSKTTDLTGVALDDMRGVIHGLSNELGIAALELAGLVETAGQLGVSGSANLAKFARQIASLTRATDLVAEDAARGLAALINLTGVEFSEGITRASDALAYLDNSIATTAARTTDSLNLISPKLVNFTTNVVDLLAIAGTSSAAQQRASTVGTALQAAFEGVEVAISEGGQGLENIAREMGQTTNEVIENYQEDNVKFLFKLLNQVRQLSTKDQIEFFESINVQAREQRATLTAIAKEGSRIIEETRAADAIGGQLVAETERQLASLAGQYDTAQMELVNSFERLGEIILEGAVPAFRALVKVIGPIGRGISGGIDALDRITDAGQIAQQFDDLPRNIQRLVRQNLGLKPGERPTDAQLYASNIPDVGISALEDLAERNRDLRGEEDPEDREELRRVVRSFEHIVRDALGAPEGQTADSLVGGQVAAQVRAAELAEERRRDLQLKADEERDKRSIEAIANAFAVGSRPSAPGGFGIDDDAAQKRLAERIAEAQRRRAGVFNQGVSTAPGGFGFDEEARQRRLEEQEELAEKEEELHKANLRHIKEIAEAREKAKQKQIDNVRDIADAFGAGMGSVVAEVGNGTKAIQNAFEDAVDNILRAIQSKLINDFIAQPISNAIATGIGSLFGGGIPLPGPATGPAGGPAPKAATGGHVTSSGIVEVGERGPEFVHLNRGATIVPLERAAGGGGPTYNFYGQMDEAGITRVIQEQMPNIMRAGQDNLVAQARGNTQISQTFGTNY